MVEGNELPKDNSIELVYKSDTVRLQKQGLYRLDTEPARFQVFEGEAVVTDPSGQLTLKTGKQMNLTGGVLTAESFNRKADDQDALYSWSDRRASYVAQANVESASFVANGSGGGSGYGPLGYNYNGFGYNPSYLGGWAFNPIFGMYTYLPYSGFGYSPFGYTYYSIATVGYASTFGSGYTYGAARSGLTGISRLASVATQRTAASGLASNARASFSGGAAPAAMAHGGGGHGGHR
jgi:hypothetical protein